MASSSGWAISRHIRLLVRRGKARVKGKGFCGEVEERVHRRKKRMGVRRM